MKLTAEKNPETIKRYAHIKPARVRGADACPAVCPGTARGCSLERGHRGVHVAHGGFRRVVAVWARSREEGRAEGSAVRRRATGTPRARRDSSPVGIVESLRRQVLSVGTDVETVIFLVMFIAFLGFAIHWVLLFTGVLR